MEVDPFRDPRLYSHEPIPLMKNFKKLFRRLDLYAMPVSLRYKGEKKFYTNYGACTSLLIILLMLAYIYTEIMLMLSQTQYESTQTVKTVVERDLATGLEAYDNVVASGVYVDMTFGIRAFHENFTDFNDPSYFTINFSQLENEYNAFND